MPYTRFWHNYIQQHGGHGGSTLSVDPAALFAVAMCLFLLACWAAYQTQSRCVECRSWPVRCRCGSAHSHERH